MKRTPEGKFVSRENMLSVWLPTLLSWCWTGALDAMLDAAARWTELRAAREYEGAAKVLRSDEQWPGAVNHSVRCAADASLWFRRRAILLDTKIRLAEIK